MKCYYLDLAQQQHGPYPDLWISQLIHSGAIDRNIQIWGEQIGEWLTWDDYLIKSQNYIECPHCGSQLEITQDLFEKKLQCPYCNEKFTAHAISSRLLWDVFDEMKKDELPLIRQWLSARANRGSKSSSDSDPDSLGIVTSGYICALKKERDEQRLKRLNHTISCQIFLLCCLVISKQVRRASVLEFREYCNLSGLRISAFDKMLSCELSKAFCIVNHDNCNFNDVIHFKIFAEYYENNIEHHKIRYFTPAYNALIPWYRKAFLQKITGSNYLTCLDDLKNLVLLPEFCMFSSILKDSEIRNKLEKIICTKIESGSFSKNEFEKIQRFLSPLPFGLEWLYNSASIQQCVSDYCVKSFSLLLQGQESVLPDFIYDMLPDISDVDQEMAKKLLPKIIENKLNFETVRHIFDILEYYGFAVSYNEKLFTLRRIYPYFLSGDSSAVFLFDVLLAQKDDLPCPSCKNHGKVLCPKCHGTKKMDCPQCSGTGKVYSRDSHRLIYCKKCQGRKKITCDNNCHADKSISGELRYYVTCKKCGGSKYISGMRSVTVGKFGFSPNGCFVRDENSDAISFELPFRQFSPFEHMDSVMASFCKEQDCFFFSDKNGLIFCVHCGTNVLGMDRAYMIEVVSKFYTHKSKTISQLKTEVAEETGERELQEEKKTELTDNEKYYLKSYFVANKDGVIDASERKMLEYQAFNILKLTQQRVNELEALAQFLDEGELQ